MEGSSSEEMLEPGHDLKGGKDLGMLAALSDNENERQYEAEATIGRHSKSFEGAQKGWEEEDF